MSNVKTAKRNNNRTLHLEIIPKIIIPMDKKLAEKTDTKPPDKISKLLYQLYLDSKDYE